MNLVRTITSLVLLTIGAVVAASVREDPGVPARGQPAAVASAVLVDINHATLAELRTLPGVGEANEALQGRKAEQQLGQAETTDHRTEDSARNPDHTAEVSRGHSRRKLSARSTGTLTRKGRNGSGSQGRKRYDEGPNGMDG